jgi:hypothetical protein
MEGPMFKKTEESLKRANYKRNIKFPNLLLSAKAYQTRKGKDPLNLKGRPA